MQPRCGGADADHAALVEQFNADFPPPWGPEWDSPIVAKTNPEEITACLHCSHDLHADCG
jgi:hypothetical protein